MSHQALNKLLLRLQKLHPKYIDLSLGRILKLLKKLQDPQLNIPPAIHIAGTNGKGSTLSFIKQILHEHNFTIHCYISPHIENIRERFILSGKIISKQKLYNTLKYIEHINNKDPITFFEIITATAFYLFSKSKANFVIIETGLGGRLDATNVIETSLLDIITPISFDHEEYLGNTLKKITNEKLGIIKKSSSILIGKQEKEIAKYISIKLLKYKNRKIFYNKNYKIVNLNKGKFCLLLNNNKINFIKPSLAGLHQIENASLAIAACYELKNYGYNINNKLINNALINTKWPGRLEKIYVNNIPYYLDGAHNVAGARELSKFLSYNFKDTWLIIGMLNTKNIYSFLKTLKKNIVGVVAIKIPNEKNSYEAKEIYNICKKLKIFCITQKNIRSAQKYLINNACPQSVIITGSLYLIGEVKRLLK